MIFQNSTRFSRIRWQASSVTQGLANGHHQLAIPLSALAKSFAFDLGLNAFLQVHTSGSVNAAINPVLNVGFNYQNGVATLDALQSNLDVGFKLSLPDFEATMTLNGLLFAGGGRRHRFSRPLGVRLGRRRGMTPDFSGEGHVTWGST